MHNLSDEALRDRWVENPYFQYFCGEVVFRHELPFDRSSLTRWRQRLDEEQIAALLQESLSVAHRSGAIQTKDTSGSWWTPPCRRKRSRIRPTPGSPILLLRWFEEFLRVFLLILCRHLAPPHLA
jgi:IS5 family transposase